MRFDMCIDMCTDLRMACATQRRGASIDGSITKDQRYNIQRWSGGRRIGRGGVPECCPSFLEPALENFLRSPFFILLFIYRYIVVVFADLVITFLPHRKDRAHRTFLDLRTHHNTAACALHAACCITSPTSHVMVCFTVSCTMSHGMLYGVTRCSARCDMWRALHSESYTAVIVTVDPQRTGRRS